MRALMSKYDDYLRWLYRRGHPNRFARLQNRLSALAFSAGMLPKRAAALEIRGRRSGRLISFPVAIADYEGGRYLVAMLGKDVNWSPPGRGPIFQSSEMLPCTTSSVSRLTSPCFASSL